MKKFIITGGLPLKGKVELCGAKNSGFKLMITALYSDKFSTISNFSKIGDVYSTAAIIRELGGKVRFLDNHKLLVSGKDLQKQQFSRKTGKLSRASTYFAGPLLFRFGKAILPVPGGDKIGKRPQDRHLEGIKALGASVKVFPERYEISAKKLSGAKYKFSKNTHGGTDVMIISSVMAQGKTVLENAAEEPEIDDLISFLNKMGAKVKRIEKRTIVIEGVKELKPAEFSVMYDRNEAVTFACAALATKGDVFVRYAETKYLSAFLKAVKESGGGYETGREGIRFFYKKELSAVDIITRPFPGFMTDWMGIWGVTMTQARGVSKIHETIYENRFGFMKELIKMGADIKFFNPKPTNPEKFYNFNLKDDRPAYFHAAKVKGPSKLKARRQKIADVRSGASLILASLIAEGESELLGVEHVDRGYENLDGRLRLIGAKIKRENL